MLAQSVNHVTLDINFYPYNAGVNKGVGCGLGNVLKTRDGEVLSGGATAASDFNGLGQSVQVYPQTAPIQGTPVYQQPVAPVQPTGVNPITGLPF